MLHEGDRVIYTIKAESWNPDRGKKNVRIHSFYGTVVKISGSTATLDLERPRTGEVVRKRQCLIKNIKRIDDAISTGTP